MGRSEDATHPDTIRAAISEFLATAIFVFAAEGSILSLGTCPTWLRASIRACMASFHRTMHLCSLAWLNIDGLKTYVYACVCLQGSSTMT